MDEAALERDDRPPICPACGVTQGLVLDAGEARFVCLECGFSDADQEDPPPHRR
jgi:hypothetical protein